LSRRAWLVAVWWATTRYFDIRRLLALGSLPHEMMVGTLDPLNARKAGDSDTVFPAESMARQRA
jgi:hypothetical protein